MPTHYGSYFVKLILAFCILCYLHEPEIPKVDFPHHVRTPCTTTMESGDCVETFSSCISLNSLVLKDCSLHKSAKVLWINNSNLDRVYLSLFNSLHKSAQVLWINNSLD